MEWRNTLEPLDLAHLIVDAITERLGSNVVLLDMSAVTLLADFFVICSAESRPQFKAITDEIGRRAKEAGKQCLAIEGEPDSGWILLDYGSVVVHLFDPDVRAYYKLEELWKQARLVVRIQ